MSAEHNTLPWKRRLNLVVVGKSGVGKSSFLNYAAGRDIFPTGTGEPVTQDYFKEVEVPSPFTGISFALYDTKGIEADNTDEWRKAVHDEIARRDRSDNIYDWFHTIIYCISAGDKRIEPFDIEAIRRLMRMGSVIVLFTKKDQVDDAHLRELMDCVTVELGSRVQTYAVCNGAVTRRGVCPPSGLENVLRGSFLGLWAKAAKVLPHRALLHATTLSRRHVVPLDVANLIAMMALAGVENRMFPDIYSLLRALGKGDFVHNRKLHHSRKIPFAYFEDVARHRPVEVRESEGYADVRVLMNIDRTFYVPAHLALNELRRHYYRKAIEIWAARWATSVDDFYSSVESGEMARRFNAYVDKAVIEILDFYNTLTGNDKQRLSQHRTTEMLEMLPEAVDAAGSRRTLTDAARRLAERADTLDRQWINTDYRRRNLEWMYMALADMAPRYRDALRLYLSRVCESLETELRAYGDYFLRTDPQAPAAADLALMDSLRRMAGNGDTAAMLDAIGRRLGFASSQQSNTNEGSNPNKDTGDTDKDTGYCPGDC